MKPNTWALADQLDEHPFDRALQLAYLDAYREDYSATDSQARRALRSILRVHYDARDCAEAWQLLDRNNPARWVCLMLCAGRCPRRFDVYATPYICPGFATPMMQSMHVIPDVPWGAYLSVDNGMGTVPMRQRSRVTNIKFTIGARWILREYRNECRSGGGLAVEATNGTGLRGR